MDDTRSALAPLRDEKYFKTVVRRALDFRGGASREALHDLEAAIKGSGLVVDGYRDPILAPTGRLLDGIMLGGENTEVMAAILVVWMESQPERVAKVKEYLSQNPPAGEEGTKDFMGTARLFRERHPEVPLEDAALMFALLAGTGPERDDAPGDEEPPPPPPKEDEQKERRERLLDREREKARKLKDETRKLQDEKDEREKRIAGLERELRDLRRQIQSQKDAEEQTINSRVREVMRKMLIDFSSPAERETFERAADDLESAIAFAKGAADRQIAANRRMGTILEVREKFRRVSELIEELEKVKDESILVVPEVDAALRRLHGIRKTMLQDVFLSRILSDRSSETPVGLDLSRIRDLDAAKSSLPILERANRLVSELKACGLLDEAGCEAMRDAIDRKIGRIVLTEGMGIGPSPPAATFDDDVRTGRLKAKDLVIDGNNVLLTSLQPDGETKVPDFTEQRESFNRNIARAGQAFRHVHVVYDGFENTVRADGNVSIVYTDKQRSNVSADDRIAEIVGGLPDKAAVLATSDRQLIDRCPKAYKVLGARDCFDYFMGPDRRGR